MKLDSEMIYEAAVDDQLFGELPSIIAKAMGARSCVLHWRGMGGAAELFAHSGYFSNDQMADYASNFADHDLWTDAGMRHGRINQAWKTSDLVSAEDYERSIFYNEWIRAMGDDTFFCCGSVIETPQGAGCVGLHRGVKQKDFSPQVLRSLNAQIGPLRRMFALRSRLDKFARQQDLLTAVFNSSGSAAFALTQDGRLLTANSAADAFLKDGRFLRIRGGCLSPVVREDQQSYDAALAAALDRRAPTASNCLLRGKHGSTVVISLTPLKTNSTGAAALITINTPREPLPRELVERHLRLAYGLSAAEADIALRLSDGMALSEIGDQRRSATGTVRTQFKHVLMKMNAKRQADVVGTVTAAYHQL